MGVTHYSLFQPTLTDVWQLYVGWWPLILKKCIKHVGGQNEHSFHYSLCNIQYMLHEGQASKGCCLIMGSFVSVVAHWPRKNSFYRKWSIVLISHCGSIYIPAPLWTFYNTYYLQQCLWFQFILFYPSSYPLSFVNHAFTYYSDASYYIQLIVGKNTNKTKKREEEEEEGREMKGEKEGGRDFFVKKSELKCLLLTCRALSYFLLLWYRNCAFFY